MPPMMSLSSHTFWIDYESGKLVESLNSGTQAKNPTFTQGDTSKVEIHLVRKNGTTREEISIPAGGTLKFGIGRLETAPTGGSFKIGYKGTASAQIAFDATASVIASALNGIPAVASEGGISVAKAGDAFLLTWNTGITHDPLTSDPDELFPSSQVILVGQVAGDVQKVLLHLQQSPIAYLETFTEMGSPEINADLIATIGTKKVYRVSIEPSPAGGSFIISGTNTTGTIESGSISVNATSYDVVNALPSTISTDASVIKSGTYSWDISISSANSLSVDGSGLVGWLGVEGMLSLNTVQIHEFLNAKETAPAVLEIAISETSGQTTLVQADCTINADLIDDGSIAPLDLTPPLSEGVANNRYVRKDVVSAPNDATQDIIWQNLGVTLDGSDLVDAIDAASAPSGGNPLATIDDVEARLPLTGGAISGDLTISGRLAIGGILAINPAHKLAIHNGNIVFSSGFGIAFGDGTTQTTAATTPDLTGYATESWVASQGFITSSSLPDLTPYARKDGATFTGKINLATLGAQSPSLNLGAAVDPNATSSVNGDLWISSASSPKLVYRTINSIFTVATTNLLNTFSSPQIIDTTGNSLPALRITQKGSYPALVVEDQTTPDSDALIIDASGNLGIGVSNSPGSIWVGSSYKMEVYGAALISGSARIINTLTVGSSGDLGIDVNGGITFNDFLYLGNGSTTLGGQRVESNPNTSGNFSSSEYPNEIIFKLSGNYYAVPCRQIV